MRNAMKKKLLSLLFVLMLFLCSCGSGSDSLAGSRPGSLVFGEGSSNGEFSYDQVPEYDGQPYAVINNNVPSLIFQKSLLNNTVSWMSWDGAEQRLPM